MAVIGQGGGGLSFPKLQTAIVAGSNITITASASAQTLTIAASGNFPAAGSIANASDTSFSTLSDGQLLIRSGTVFRNQSVGGDLRVTTSGNFTIQSGTISGAKIPDRGVPIAKIDTDGKNSGDILEVNTNSSVDVITRQTLVSSVLEFSGSVSASVVSNKIRITGTDTNTDSLIGMTDTDIAGVVSGHILIWNGNDFQNRSMQGDATLSANGTITIGSKKVTLTKIDGGSSSGFLFTDTAGNLTASAVTQGGGGGSTTLGGLTDVTLSSPSNGQVLKFNGTNWVNGTDNAGEGGGSNLTAGDGITISSGVISTDESVTRIIDFGNDTTDNIATAKFVSILDGLDGNGVLAGEEADTSSKIPVGISVKAIPGKSNSGADALESQHAVFVAGAYKPASSMLEGSFTGAVDKQAVFLKWVTNQWKLTLEKTQWLVATHHNGTMIFDFEAMHNVQDRADQIVSNVSAFSGDIDRSNDGIFMDDNGAGKNIDWTTLEA